MNNKIEREVLKLYDYAEKLVYQSGYGEYVTTLRDLLQKKPYKNINKSEFLKQYTWSVFTCGFKADTVRSHWSEIQEMLFNFNVKKIRKLSFEDILDRSPIKNKRKVNAIYKTCRDMDDKFIEKIKNIGSKSEAQKLFKSLPFIGDITVFHILRNLGIDCYKPDRHIVTLAKNLKIDENELFQILLSHKKDKYIGILDFILWRASACLNSAKKLIKFAKQDHPLEEIDILAQADKNFDFFLY
ncbi:MAG: hypothetical protein ACOCT9_00705 [archaeon]